VLVLLIVFASRAFVGGVVVVAESCRLADLTSSADGYQVKAMARAWAGEPERVRGERFFRVMVESGGLATSHLVRFFPVSAGILALGAGAGLSEGLASTLPFWLLAGVGSGLVAVWARDVRAGLLVGFLPPIAVATSVVPGSAYWAIGAAAGGLLALEAKRPFVAGLALGLAGWSRPEGLFPALGAAVASWRRGGAREAATLAAGVAVPLLALVALVGLRLGPLLGEIAGAPGGARGAPAFLDWPGAGLIAGLLAPETAGWKRIYVVAHLLVALAALVAWARRARSAGTDAEARRATACGVWLGLQLLLTLVLAGSQGFDDLPRYLSLASPAVVLGLLPWVPRSRSLVATACALGLAVALEPTLRTARPECRGAPGSATDPARSLSFEAGPAPARRGAPTGPAEGPGSRPSDVTPASAGPWARTS
jgi:hypothetical protein